MTARLARDPRFLDDNMHDLCLAGVPAGAVLTTIATDGALVQKPDGVANGAQTLTLP